MSQKQYSFSELSRKTVVNVADGRELGHVCDMVFDCYGRVLGLVVPGKRSFFKSLTTSENVYLPWNRIIKIGSDVILVELVGNPIGVCNSSDNDNLNDAYSQQNAQNSASQVQPNGNPQQQNSNISQQSPYNNSGAPPYNY